MTLGEGVQQFQVFVVFVVLGLALGAVYLFGIGLFRARLAAIIFDVVFGAASVYAVFAVNLAVNNGEFRLFVLIAIALGVFLSVLTCKTLLDKASSALYNLFTTREDDLDDARISQQKNIHTNSSGGDSSSAFSLHAVDNSLSAVVPKPKRRASSSANKRAVRQRNRTKRTSSIHANRRVRKALGGKQRQDG